ncbi:unnamed protein product [Caenorhabditis sp. 36 PRJEB53466]|nr:unnamed protein product [Caenorhabditis sp. 36 PRJEB53466]
MAPHNIALTHSPSPYTSSSDPVSEKKEKRKKKKKKKKKTENNYALSIEKRFGIPNIARIKPLKTSPGEENQLIPPFIPFRSTFVTSPKYSLAACRIQKNLSTILLNLFCFLNTPRKFTRRASSLTIEFKNYVSVETCNDTHATHIGADHNFTTLLAIIRDPVERFLSGFVDKCIHEANHKKTRCYGCNKNMMCVLKAQYERFQLIADGKLTNFSYEDRHFAPMSWFCDFTRETVKNYRFLYFGETEEEQGETVDELMTVFEDHGVDNHTTTYISEELSANRTKHSTSGSMIRIRTGYEMRKSKEAMKMLYLIYENDYKAFNLNSPFSNYP